MTSTSQRAPIGSACATSGQSGTGAFYCDLSWPSGYCKEGCASDGDCPNGALCVGAGLVTGGTCLTACAHGAGCRAGDLCMGDASRSWCAAPELPDGA